MLCKVVMQCPNLYSIYYVLTYEGKHAIYLKHKELQELELSKKHKVLEQQLNVGFAGWCVHSGPKDLF